MTRKWKAAALACALAVWGCGDKTEAHLERFLDAQQEQPAAEGESLDPFAMAEDPKVADRIHTMGFGEVAHRLGAHRFQSSIAFTFSSPETQAWLRESDRIVLARNGDFRVMVENDGGQGYELIYTGGRLYMRNRYGPFHERPTLSGDHIKWRDAAYGGWAAVYRLFRGRLRFTRQGMTRHHGRDAVRFAIGLSTDQPRLPGTPEPPAVPDGVTQYVYPIESTPSDLHRWRDKARPRQANGRVLVDTDNGVILEAELTGRFTLPAPPTKTEDGGVAGSAPGLITLTLTAKLRADGFGNPPSIAPPSKESVRPIPERTPVDTHPLDFYFGEGFTSSLGKPAGVAAASKDKKRQDDKSAGGSASKP